MYAGALALGLGWLMCGAGARALEMRPMNFKRNAEYCEKQSKDPYFDIDVIVGEPWRIYYTWNVQMEDKCLDMTFKNATPPIVNRFWTDMHEYLETQPVWDAAILYTTLGTAKHELLLFVDQGPAGSLDGVPNVIKDGNITPVRGGVPLLKFFIKLLDGGRFLMLMDCRTGVSSLMSRARPPLGEGVTRIAKSFNLGYGSPACVVDKRSHNQYKLK